MKTKVFTFGRMNPPTQGHELLIQGIIKKAKELNADYELYLSQKEKSDTDPLEWEYKISVIENIFPNICICKDKTIRTPFEALEKIALAGYKKVILIVGEDRVDNFKERMTPYINLWGIEEFEVISIGFRDPDANGVEGISASKLREFAHNDNKDEFVKGLSVKLSDNQKQEIFDKIKECV